MGVGNGIPSLRNRLYVTVAAGMAVVAVLVTLVAAIVYQAAARDDARRQLSHECAALSSVLEGTDDKAAFLEKTDMDVVRVTLVGADGTVLYDSAADASTMENHTDRPEVADAFASGEGWSERDSVSVGQVQMYRAQRLSTGEVVRLSYARDNLVGVLRREMAPLLVVMLVALAATWFVSRWVAGVLVRPIMGIDPSSGEATAPYEELEPLVTRLNEQHGELMDRMEAIQNADDIRREFTANVTHELKTPIASISGAAELIRDGIVKPEDVSGFAGRIYDDAQRLTSLVNDILMLSKLDEAERTNSTSLFGDMEVCDLMPIARDVADRYAARAEEFGVRIQVQGVSSLVRGNPRLLDELVGNIVSNAVRYNKPGGKVFVWVYPRDGRPSVRVSDTGIGIPEEDQKKVFERFYRVDKGRSRARGGTGLGLAIVKHAAAYHGADLKLKSTPGVGTSVTVTFPAQH